MMKTIVKTTGLKKNYVEYFPHKINEALRGVDIEVYENEIFGIIGPNGSGKTTLINCLAMLLKPDEGSIMLFGHDSGKDRKITRSAINLCSGNPNLVWCMTVRENLLFYGMLYGIGSSVLNRRIEDVMTALDIKRYESVRYDELSTGTKQRLALAKSLINQPKLLFLDEPTVGLDPDMADRTRLLIKKIHREQGTTILLTTHYMAEAEELCGRIAFILDGKVFASGTPDELKKNASADNLEEVFLRYSRSGDNGGR